MVAAIEHVTVHRGGRVALADVSLAAPAGGVTAVVGGDGAGKTTLLRVLSGVVAADEGEVRIPAAGSIGAMVEVPGVWADLTVDEHVRFVAAAYGLGPDARRRRGELLLARAGLERFGDRLARDLSGGMRQKLAVVLAILHEPALVVLDEPTTGVDPTSRAELWRLIGGAAASGAAVVVTTTYLDEAERAADVLVLHDGRPLLAGDPAAHVPLEDTVIELQRRQEVPA